MKKALWLFVLAWALQSVCLAASVKQLPNGNEVDLRAYQQKQGTLNVMAASFDGAQMYLGAFNFDGYESDGKMAFSRGIGIFADQAAQQLRPLLVKQVSGSAQGFSEQMVNKDGTAPYKHNMHAVQTGSRVPVIYIGGDATNMVMLGRFAVTTGGGNFDDCIGIKIYNDKTGEGMVQYLAKDHGIIYLEGVRSDGSSAAIAELHEIRSMDEAAADNFKQNYFTAAASMN